MRVLILGGNGMIGHKIYQYISKEYIDTWITLRNKLETYSFSHIYDSKKVIDHIDLTDLKYLKNTLEEIKPDIIINACGITIRRGVDKLKSNTIFLNSLLPHFLNEWVTSNNKRLIHFSTDCVFSGKKGDYKDNDQKDADDLYGTTKSIGEVLDSKFAITLRGSMIGRELENKTELFEWFLNQKNKTIRGFSEVIYSGITTVKMAEIVLILIKYHEGLNGIYNISSKPISKFNLLSLCNEYFEVNAIIELDNSYISNKNLISDNFFNKIGIEQPAWIDLIRQLNDDCLINKTLYN
jgi:dTDP-4-dehydrorhamnose reductase